MFSEAGIKFDESQFVPTVAGYYTDSKTGHLLSQPFNSSTPVLYYNKDAFKKAGLDPDQPPKTSAGSGGLHREAESRRDEVRLRQRLAGLDPD